MLSVFVQERTRFATLVRGVTNVTVEGGHVVVPLYLRAYISMLLHIVKN